jgi:acyl-CoA oxidase
MDGKGCVIAEGDILALCIRLFSQLIRKQYQVIVPESSSSILAHRATELLDRYSTLARNLRAGHRGEGFNQLLLPHAEETIAAIGHALAYDSARRAGIDQKLLDVYTSFIMSMDPGWFISTGGYSTEDMDHFQSRAIRGMLPDLERYLDDLKVDRYVRSPLVKEDGWAKYYPRLPKFTGDLIAKL